MLRKFVVVCGALVLGACAARGPLKATSQELVLKVATGQMVAADDNLPAHGKADHLKEFERLVAVAHQHGVQVYASDTLDWMGLWGLYQVKAHAIYLNDTLDNNGTIAVLAHEIGHVLLDPELPAPDDDIAAQAVSYIVMKRLGLDTSEETLGYYLDYGTPLSVQYTLMRRGKEIDRVVNIIMSEMPKVK